MSPALVVAALTLAVAVVCAVTLVCAVALAAAGHWRRKARRWRRQAEAERRRAELAEERYTALVADVAAEQRAADRAPLRRSIDNPQASGMGWLAGLAAAARADATAALARLTPEEH